MDNMTKIIKVQYKDLAVANLGAKSVNSYKREELEQKIRSTDCFRGLIFPNQELVFKYTDDREPNETFIIKTDFQLQNAMRYCAQLELVIEVDAFYTLRQLTQLLTHLCAKLLHHKSWVETLVTRSRKLKTQQNVLSLKLQQIEDRILKLESQTKQ